MTVRSLLLSVLCLLWTAPAWAVMTIGTSVTVKSDGALSTLDSPAIAVTADQALFVCVKWEGNAFTLTSLADTPVDTFVLGTTQQHTGATPEPSGRCGWVISPTVSASNVIRATFSGAAIYRRMTVYTINKNGGTFSFDVQSANSVEADSDLTPSSEVVTTTGTDEICFGHQIDYTNQAFTLRTINGVTADGQVEQSDTSVFYKIFTGTFVGGASSLTRGTAVRWLQRLTCFKATSGGSPPVSSGTDYWVAPASSGGSNSNGCTQVDSVSADPPTDPGVYKLTLANALSCLTAGDRLIIKAGTYTDQQILNPISGASSSRRTAIMGDPSGARPLITYSGHPVSTANIGVYCTVSTACSDLLVKYLEISESYVGMKLSLPGVYNRVEVNDIYIHDTTDTCWLQSTATASIGGSHIVRNSHFAYCGKNYPVANGGAKYIPGMLALYGIGSNGLIERNEFEHNTHSVGIWYSGTTQSNVTVRYNSFHDNARYDVDTWMNQGGTTGSYRGPLMIEVAVPGGGHQIYNNVFYNNGCATCGSSQLNVTGVMAGVQANATSTANIYNNSFYNFLNPTSLAVCTNGGASGWCATAPFTSKNNIAYLVNGGFTGTESNNQLTNPTFTSTTNLSLGAGSNAISAGTNVSLPFNGTPENGAHETFSYQSATITGNTMLVQLGMNLNTPVLPATGMTGFTVNNGRTVTAAIRQASSDSIVQLTISGSPCADSDSWTVTYTPGNVTDSSLIGNSENQPMTAFSAQAVTNVNCSGGTPPTYEFTHKTHQFLDAFYLTGTSTTVPLSAIGAANTDIHSGIPFAIDVQTDCTVANCPAIGQRLYYSRTPLSTGTPSAFAALTDVSTGTDHIGFYGNTGDVTVLHGNLTAVCLTGALTATAGITLQTSSAIPVFDLPQNGCTVNRYVLQLGTDAILGDIYTFKVYNQDGTAFTTYSPVGGAKVTVTPVAPISAPTSLTLIGTNSNTMIEMIWMAFAYPNFAGYHIYQCSTTPCTSTNWVRVGENTTAIATATHSSITTFRTTVSASGTYYFVVTAFDTGNQESAASAELAVTRTGAVARTPRVP